MSKHTPEFTQPQLPFDEIEYGKCGCGCGNPTNLARNTDPTRARVKGQPMRFLKGHVGKLQTKRPTAEKFWEKVAVGGPDECWDWTASLVTGGYGNLNIDGVTTHAHRVSWQIHFGPIPDGMEVCHKCDRRKCCNPAHLFLGTHQDNMDDRNQKNRQARQYGTTNASAKLDAFKVKQIRQLARDRTRQVDIAERFGVSVSLVEKIIAHKVWKHV